MPDSGYPIVYILALIMIAVVGAASHLCLKWGAAKPRHFRFPWFIFEPWTLLGIVLMAAGVLAQTVILRYLPLVLVMPISALVYVLLPLGASLFLKERVGRRFWLGAALLVIGVCLIGFSL